MIAFVFTRGRILVSEIFCLNLGLTVYSLQACVSVLTWKTGQVVVNVEHIKPVAFLMAGCTLPCA